jgi:hypothetical protein
MGLARSFLSYLPKNCLSNLLFADFGSLLQSIRIFYHRALTQIHVTVTDGYYRIGYNHEPIITQTINVEHWPDV